MRKSRILSIGLIICLIFNGCGKSPSESSVKQSYEHIIVDKEVTPTPVKIPEVKDEVTPEVEPQVQQPESAASQATFDEEGFEIVDDYVKISGTKLNMRLAPNLDSKVLVVLKRGEKVHRIGKGKDGFDKLMYNETVVYAYNEYITAEE